jgi:hypothetical protein
MMHPTKSKSRVGGAQNIVLNFCKYAEVNGVEVKVFDYSNGYIYKNLSSEKLKHIKLIKLDSPNFEDNIDTDDIFISFNKGLRAAPYYWSFKNCRLFFWDLDSRFWDRFLTLNVRKKTLEFLLEKNALIFMDCWGLKKVEKISDLVISKDNCVNIFNDGVKCEIKKTSNNFGKIRIFSVARAVKWKLDTIGMLIKDLNKSGVNYSFDLYTDNEKKASSYIEDVFGTCDINYYEGYNGNSLIEKGVGGYDIYYGMGTTLLDFSMNGIPCIIADPVLYKQGSENCVGRYKWLTDLDNTDYSGSVGTDLNDEGYLSLSRPIEIIIKEYISEKDLLSERMIGYYEKYHSPDFNCGKLIQLANKTSLTMHSYKSYVYGKPFLNFSLWLKVKIKKFFENRMPYDC